MREIRDTTVTIHPTVKLSFAYALDRIAEKENLNVGKALEKCMEECKDFQEYIKEFHNVKRD